MAGSTGDIDSFLYVHLQGVAFEEMIRQVLSTGGPVAHATRPETVRLHDDKVGPMVCWTMPVI